MVFEVVSFLGLCCIDVNLCRCRIFHIVLWCVYRKYKLGKSRCVLSFFVVVIFGPLFSSGVLCPHHFHPGPIESIWFPLLLCVFALPKELLG